MTTGAEWADQTGKSWARECARTDRSFSALTPHLIDHILARGAAHSILDIGCGAGELSLKLSTAKPGAQVLGVDISSELIAVAQSRTPKGARCSFHIADASAWQDDQFRPDLLISRHGVMFFDEPVSAFANLKAAASPGARMVFSCFRDRAENEWANALAAILPPLAPPVPHAPGPFGFADPDHVRDVLTQAGWTMLQHIPVDFEYIAGAGDDPVADAVDFFQAIGPAAPMIRSLEGDAKARVLAKLTALAQSHLSEGQVRFAAAAWIMVARL
jgi:SAM-dependent methyltransferase